MMEHNELLAKIDTLNYLGRVGYVSSIWNALRAVLELHSSMESANMNNQSIVLCQECECLYPCPTIRAIKAELA